MRVGLLLALLLTLPGPSRAAEDPGDVLRGLLGASPGAEQFSDDFLRAVPLDRIRAILHSVSRQIGPVLSVSIAGDRATVRSATHAMPARITLDAAGRVTALWLEPPVPLPGDLDGALPALDALGGTVAWLVSRDGAVLAAREAGVPLPVASAFKLGVLAVLAGDVAAGRRDWAEVLRLAPRHRAPGSGRLRDFPDGAPLTLHSLAALMIADSDNTATDILIEALGPDRIAAVLGVAAVPTTRAVLVDGAPGWAVPLDRLCALIGDVAGLPLMAINPGPVPPADWAGLAFKGGSMPGVLNLTAHVEDAAGARHCVAVTVNDPDGVDEAAAVAAFRGVLSGLSAR